MRSIVTALILCLSLNLSAQLQTNEGEYNQEFVMAYFVNFNKQRHAHNIDIDFGHNNIFGTLYNEGSLVWIKSPLELIVFMDKRGYTFLKTESYIESDHWYTAWIFIKD